MRLEVDKIASVTRNLRLNRMLTLSEDILLEEGSVIAVQIRNEKSRYNQLEDVHGRLSTLHEGDIVVGALGKRHALHGYEGVMPESAKPGDILNVLNIGGVIGVSVSHNPDVGPPFQAELLGQVQVFPDFQSRKGQPAHVRMGAIARRPLEQDIPLVLVAGTCMNSGKTAAACALVKALHRSGLRVGGAKLTGISLMRDTLAMNDYGAEVVADFTDAGIVCTGPENSAWLAHTVLAEVASRGVEVIVAETGDGIMGEYGVQAILADPEIRRRTTAFLFCANDPVGVAGGLSDLKARYGIEVDLVCGPATDNRVGCRFVERLGLPAFNARNDPRALGEYVRRLVQQRSGVGRD